MVNNIEAPREPNDLFKKGRVRRGETLISSEAETRVLPLGEFSEFILTEQPRMLTEIRAGNLGVEALIQRQRELLTNLNPRVVEMAAADPMLADIAMLDLTFAINGVVAPISGGVPPDEVEQLSAHFARVTGLQRTMTFQKIVTINSKLPYQQMRTFTDGEIGETERMFYYGHELMDVRLRETTRAATDAVAILTANGREQDVEVSLMREVDNMNIFADYMKGFFRMPPEHFSAFREYLKQYRDGIRNASGAFIGMPRLNLRLMGSAPFYEQFLDLGRQYFSIEELPDIDQARIVGKQDNHLIALCERSQGDDQRRLAGILKQLIEPLHQFRLLHLKAVLKYVRGAIPEGDEDLETKLKEPYESILEDQSDVLRGTGGFIPGPLLRNMLRLDLKSLVRLEAILNKEDQK